MPRHIYCARPSSLEISLKSYVRYVDANPYGGFVSLMVMSWVLQRGRPAPSVRFRPWPVELASVTSILLRPVTVAAGITCWKSSSCFAKKTRLNRPMLHVRHNESTGVASVSFDVSGMVEI